MSRKGLAAISRIEHAILVIRGQKVMLDDDLARLYGVEVRALNQAVKRNRARFPPDFMFQLTTVEAAPLRSQIVILEERCGRYRKFRPYAFTEQGVSMLSSVLRSQRAIGVNIEIMRAFVHLRRMLAANAELAQRLATLENKSDTRFKIVFDAIRELMAPRSRAKRAIGFRA
jgi:hypothetical protein